MARVANRRDKWTLDYRDQNGKRRWETTQGNKKEAELLLAERLQEIDRGSFQAKREQTTFDELAKAYIANVKVRLRDLTADEYEENIQRHLLPYFTGKRLRAIRRRDIEDFRAWMITRGQQGLPHEGRKGDLCTFGAATVNKCLTLAAMVFGYAVENEWIGKNPASRIGKVKPARAADDDEDVAAEALEKWEIQALLNNALPHWRIVLRVAVYTGLRQCELLGLRWDDIDMQAGTIRVRRSLRQGRFYEPKTATSRRPVPLGADLLVELQYWKLACPTVTGADGQPRLDLVFPTLTGRPQNPSNLLNRGFHPARQRAKLRPMKFHWLRHTFGSHLIAEGVNLKTVSTLMGHSSINVTVDVYGHMLQGSDRDAIERLERAIGSRMVATATEEESEEPQVLEDIGRRCEIRTRDQRIKSPLLYQLS